MSDDKIVKLHGHEDPELEALYQQADKPMPPGHLDTVIKQAARAPLTPRRSGLTPWFAGVAVSVLLGVLLIRLYPTALPTPPGRYLEQESRPARTQTVESPGREILQPAPVLTDTLDNTPAKSGGVVPRNQLQTPPGSVATPAERKRPGPVDLLNRELAIQPAQNKPALPPSPALKSMGSSNANLDETEMTTEFSTEVSAQDRQDDFSSPQSMLENILELLEQEKTEDAKQLYQAFRQLHPDYELSTELAERLRPLVQTR